jgi:hypothetical protein
MKKTNIYKDAMMELCRDEGMQLYKVMSTCELLGLRAAMEEDEVERILGSDSVHMTEDGFVTLAETSSGHWTILPHCLLEKRGAGTCRWRGWWWVAGGERPMNGCTAWCLGLGPGGTTGCCRQG